MNKYLNEGQLKAIIGESVLPSGFVTMSQDSYNEELIANKVKMLNNPPDLIATALNLAIVGFGNKKYGQFRTDEGLIQVATVFKKYNIITTNVPGAAIKEDDITPQRLCRFYRYEIKNYLYKNKFTSYLWRKYTKRDPSMLHICFRGSEYLDDLTKDQADYILNAVIEMDSRLGTNIQERVIRVYEARNQMFTLPEL